MAKNKKCIDNYLNAILKDKSSNKQSKILQDIISFADSLISNENIWLFLNSPLMGSTEKNGFLENFAQKLKTEKNQS